MTQACFLCEKDPVVGSEIAPSNPKMSIYLCKTHFSERLKGAKNGKGI